MEISVSFQNICKKIFNKENIEDIGIPESLSMQSRYTYFMFATYMATYMQKMNFQDAPYETALQPDPLWFAYVLDAIKPRLYKAQTNQNLCISEPTSTEAVLEAAKPDNLPTHTKTIEDKITPIDEVNTTLNKDSKIVGIPKESTTSFEPTLVEEISNTGFVGETNNLAVEQPADIELINEDIKTTEPQSFIPLYVEDYFASQNIKTELPTQTELSLPSNKPPFVRVVNENNKSFMDWLNDFEEKNPPKRATQNIKNDIPVASETMAEIWIAEQRYDKAIITYEKLSLLFPEKSIYFAQKIKNLEKLLGN